MTIRTKILSVFGEEYVARLFWFLSGFLGILIASYLFLLMMTVSNVVAREQAEASLSLSYSRIGELESAYLSKKNTVTLALARGLGYSDASKIDFISRKPLSSRLSLSDLSR